MEKTSCRNHRFLFPILTETPSDLCGSGRAIPNRSWTVQWWFHEFWPFFPWNHHLFSFFRYDLSFFAAVATGGTDALDLQTALEFTSDFAFLEMIHRLIVCVFEALCLHRSTGSHPGGATPGKLMLGLRVVSCTQVGLTNDFLKYENLLNNLNCYILDHGLAWSKYGFCFSSQGFRHCWSYCT